MREEYTLSYLTKDALESDIKAIADEMGLESPRYLYAILGEKQTDPYAPFKRYFRALARVSPEHARLYIQDLRSLVPNEIRHKASGSLGEGMGRITKAYFELLERAGGDDKDEISAQLQAVSTMCNRLWNDLNPVGLRPVKVEAS
jgi:hypothetical protein